MKKDICSRRVDGKCTASETGIGAHSTVEEPWQPQRVPAAIFPALQPQFQLQRRKAVLARQFCANSSVKSAAILTDCRAFLNVLNAKIVSPKPVFSYVNAPFSAGLCGLPFIASCPAGPPILCRGA